MFRRLLLAACLLSSLALAGCGSGGSATTPAAPTAPFLVITPSTSLSFANTTVGQTSASQVLTFTNTGNAALTLTSLVNTGAATGFTSSYTCGSTLAAGASCTVTIAFAPLTAGAQTASFIVTDNATNSPQTITLAGTGVAAVIPVPMASLSASSITFPATASNSTSASQSVTLTNTSTTNGTLAISGIVLGGPDFLNYYESNTCGATLVAGASCTISATVTPTAASTSYNGTITITDNANNVANSTQVIALTETSAAAVTAPTAILSPTVLNFPSTTVNVSAGNLTVSLSNPGTAPLTGISFSITGGTTATAFTIVSTTCGGTLAAGATPCTITINFTPTITGSFTAYLNVADNATGSPQQATLNGTSTAVAAPVATLSAPTISFPTTTVGATTASYSVTLSNTGNAVLNLASISAPVGTGAAAFTKSTTCLTTLAAGASCTISSTFSPSAANSYAATITLTDNSNNAANSTQTIALSGSGTTSAVSYQIYQLPDPGTGPGSGTMAALYSLVNNAQKTIDMTMYALSDTTFSGDLVAACNRGVKVRVVLDQNSEKSQDTPAYNQINAATNCSAVWANKAFNVTHEKSFIVDGTTMALMSLNLQTQYYSTTRDFAMVYNDPVDIAAVQATFNMDYAAGTPASGVAGASDYSYQPGAGNDLIWSPTTAQANMESIINNATTSLLIDAEELTSSASYIVTDIANACKRGVSIRFTLENESGEYNSQLATIKAAGCGTHYYSSSTGFYVHAKAVIADYGLSTQNTYLGSINYSNASMNSNRELGMFIHDNASVVILYNAMVSDYTNATGTY